MTHMHGGRHEARHHSHGGFHLIGKHRGRSGPGKFMGGFMGGSGRDGSGFRTGRKLSSEDLQLLLLALLEKQPSHGYELIKSLEERSGGFYSPSPGMIYPALTYLEEIGHATVEADGAKKLYQLTPDGAACLDQRRTEAEAILSQLEHIGQRMGDVRRAFSGNGEDEADPADIRQARHALRRALRDKRQASPEEHRRIAVILRRAVEEIDGKLA